MPAWTEFLIPATVGAVGGVHAATWGMYKDSPHEGFTWRTYLRSVWVGLLLGSAGGWISAFGGAWKDAPIEGFEIRKFFRSPIIALLFALLSARFTADWLLVAIVAVGYTIATTETYKTFFFPSVPRGKFAGKPVLCPGMLRLRHYFVPLYVGIWAAVAGAVSIALGVLPRVP